MANTEALSQLKDIHLPEAISGNLAPGWYLVLFFVLFSVIIFLYFIRKKQAQALAKKQALLLLEQSIKHYENDKDASLACAKISEILRRVALAYYSRSTVASLHGHAWLEFLNQNSKKIDFTPVQSLLLDAPFKTGESLDLEPLISRARLWIKQRGKPCSN